MVIDEWEGVQQIKMSELNVSQMDGNFHVDKGAVEVQGNTAHLARRSWLVNRVKLCSYRATHFSPQFGGEQNGAKMKLEGTHPSIL